MTKLILWLYYAIAIPVLLVALFLAIPWALLTDDDT